MKNKTYIKICCCCLGFLISRGHFAQSDTAFRSLFYPTKLPKAHLQAVLAFIDVSENDSVIEVLNTHALRYSDSLINTGLDSNVRIAFHHLSSIWSNVGYLEDNAGRSEKALAAYFKAYVIAKQFGVPEALGAACNNIGSSLALSKKYMEAQDYFLEGYSAYAKAKQTAGMALSLSNTGSVLFRQGLYNEAANFFNKSYGLRKIVNDRHGMAWSLNSLAAVKNRQNLFLVAIDYNKEALLIQTEDADLRGILYSYQNLALCYYDSKDFAKAEAYAYKALAHVKTSGIKSEIKTTEEIVKEIVLRTRDRSALPYEKVSTGQLVKDTAFHYEEKASIYLMDLIKMANGKIAATQQRKARFNKYLLFIFIVVGLASVALVAVSVKRRQRKL